MFLKSFILTALTAASLVASAQESNLVVMSSWQDMVIASEEDGKVKINQTYADLITNDQLRQKVKTRAFSKLDVRDLAIDIEGTEFQADQANVPFQVKIVYKEGLLAPMVTAYVAGVLYVNSNLEIVYTKIDYAQVDLAGLLAIRSLGVDITIFDLSLAQGLVNPMVNYYFNANNGSALDELGSMINTEAERKALR